MLDSASVRHVEELLLQPSVVMVVTITSSGGVAKKLITFERAVDNAIHNVTTAATGFAPRFDLSDAAADYLEWRRIGA